MTQFYKGDEREKKFYNTGLPILDQLSAQKTLLYDDAFNCFILGEVLHDANLAPLAQAMPREIFRTAFATIFEAFIVAGTFESYLTVFRKIFGADVEVEFTVPAPGRLEIDITATGIEYVNFVARKIVNNAYEYDEIVEEDGNNLVFRKVKGFETQYELEQMLFELVPNGIYTVITLTL